MAEAQFKLTGVDGIIDNMAKLSAKLQKTTARRAARRAMVPVRDGAIANAKRIDDPKTRNRIYRNIAIQERSRTGRQIGGVAFSVGVRGGARSYASTRQNRRLGRVGRTYRTGGSAVNPGGDTWYWRLVEFGTKRTKAQPVLRPAFSDSNQQKAIDILATELWAGIKEAQK